MFIFWNMIFFIKLFIIFFNNFIFNNFIFNIFFLLYVNIYLSISPNTISTVPIIATKSAKKCPLASAGATCKWW